MQMIRIPLLALFLGGFLGLNACSEAAVHADENHGEHAGTLQITASMDPDPPRVGQNVLNALVLDRDGAPVDGATVTVTAEMPMHGHGSTEHAVVTGGGEGQYTADPVTFQMPGMWQVTVQAKTENDTGSKTFEYNVQ